MIKNIEEENDLKQPNIFQIILKPQTLFENVLHNPVIIRPLLIVGLIMIISGVIYSFSIDVSLDPILQEYTNRQLFDYFSFYIMNSIIFVVITALFYAIVQYPVAKIYKSPVTFSELVSLNFHLALIPAIGVFVNSVINYFTIAHPTNDTYYTSFQVFYNKPGILSEVLGAIELFMIWEFAIMAIALIIVAQLPKKIAWNFVALFYFVYIALDIAAVYFK